MKGKLIILTALIATSCLFPGEEEDLDVAFARISNRKNPVQHFVVNSEATIIVNGRLGTRIEIQPGSLVTMDGETVSGEIEIELKEIYTPAEMIFNNITTTNNGHLLSSSGMVHIEASASGQDLKVKQGDYIEVRFPMQVETPYMRAYLGEESANGINWELDLDSPDTLFIEERYEEILTLDYGVDSVFGFTRIFAVVGLDTILVSEGDDTTYLRSTEDSTYYNLRFTALAWINCDYFPSGTELRDVRFASSEGLDQQTYLIFKDINAVMPAYWETDGGSSAYIPVNEPFRILSIVQEDGDYQVSQQDVPANSSQSDFELEYKEVTLEELEGIVSGLDN